jgi:hypothetical protein
MKTMSATIQIDAPPATVWAVLTDLDRYPEWNPLFLKAEGQLVVGQRITLRTIYPVNGREMTVKPKITVVKPDAELRWESSLPGIMSGDHRFTLTSTGPGTRLEQSETVRGLLTIFPGQTWAKTEASFGELNQALKQRAEGNAPPPA